jgi:hypothetical protein
MKIEDSADLQVALESLIEADLARVQVMTEDGRVYSIKSVEHEAAEEDNPLDHFGTVWIKVEEL